MATCSITEIAQRILLPDIREGDVVVDATAGNGHDTLFLARAIGEAGHVYACDIQPEALAATHRLLEKHGVAGRVEVALRCHRELKRMVPDELHGKIAAAVFNLGYLPGGDKSITTATETTLLAVEAAFALLRPLGHLCVVIYPGHPAGASEAEAVTVWATSLPAILAHVAEYRMVNRSATSPLLLHIQKAAGSGK